MKNLFVICLFVAPLGVAYSVALGDAERWNVRFEKSLLDDSMNVYLWRKSIVNIRTKYGAPVTPLFVIACTEDVTSAHVSWDTYISSKDVPVLVRQDSDDAIELKWDISTDRESTFIRRPIAFVRSLLKRKQLVVEVTPFGESPVMAIFNLDDLAEAIKPLAEACHWKVSTS